jgi:predicted transcriptional regulator
MDNSFRYNDQNRTNEKRKPPALIKSFRLNEMRSVHHEIVRFALWGYKQVEIAKLVGVTPQVVSYTLNSQVVKAKLGMMHERRDADAINVTHRIRELAPEALELIEQAVRGDLGDQVTITQRLKEANTILDRAGFSPQRQVSIEHTKGSHYSPEEIEELKQLAKDSGMVVDVEAEIVGDEGEDDGNDNGDGKEVQTKTRAGIVGESSSVEKEERTTSG